MIQNVGVDSSNSLCLKILKYEEIQETEIKKVITQRPLMLSDRNLNFSFSSEKDSGHGQFLMRPVSTLNYGEDTFIICILYSSF